MTMSYINYMIMKGNEEMKLNAETRELFRAVNESLKKMKKEGIETDATRELKQELEIFYKEAGKDIKNKDRINLNVKLDETQQEQFNAMIMNIAENTQQLDYERLIEGFQNQPEDARFHFDNVQDYVDFIDRMNRFKNDRMLSSILSSSQIQELAQYGKTQGISDDDIEEFIAQEYSMTGRTGDDLYNKILDTIENIEDIQQAYWRD